MENAVLPPEAMVNYYIESARGFRRFGDANRAHGLLEDAHALAVEHGFNRSVFEAEEMLANRTTGLKTPSEAATRTEYSESTAGVEQELRTMALAVS